MSRIPHPNPQLAKRGVTVTMDSSARPSPVQDPRTSPRSDLIDEFPDVLSFTSTFRSIPVSGDASGAVPAGLPAWRGLMSLEVGRDVRQDMALDHIEYELGSPDVSGLFVDDLDQATPWGGDPSGNATGVGACIVVGENLPIDLNGGWTFNPLAFAGWIIPDADGGSFSDGNTGVRQPLRSMIHIKKFPPGKWSDVPPLIETYQISLGKKQRRLSHGNRIDVALVLRPNTYTAAEIDRTIKGWCMVTLKFAATINPGDFRR